LELVQLSGGIPGEILGITGLLGSGRTELALALFGIHKATSGDIFIDGEKVKINNVNDAINAKIGYVPEDRLTEGLFLHQSIGKNIVLPKLKELSNRLGIINKQQRDEEVKKWVEKLSIATPDPSNEANTLSGGNQQRIVLAKSLALDLNVLILNGPTVGVDIGSKHDIHEILQELAAEGLGIIIISDDLREVVANCSRLLIMRGGRIVGEEDPDVLSVKDLSKKITTKTAKV
jgi:simple sugar transport system ATP-binding protein